MKERPIIFSTEMVKAILDGRKTQTRRVVKPQPKVEQANVWYNLNTGMFDFRRCYPWFSIKCPYGQIGDRLWVRETWAYVYECGHYNHLHNERQKYIYKADNDCIPLNWRPSIHMPRWASRITLEITGIRVERVQDISEADIKRGYSWESNPWVWAIEFKVISANKGGE